MLRSYGQKVLGFFLIALSGMSLFMATSNTTATPVSVPARPSTTVETHTKQGYAVESSSLDLEGYMPSINDMGRFLPGSLLLAADGPIPERSLLRSPLSRSAGLISSLRAGWVRAFLSRDGVVSVSVLSVSPTARPVKAHPDDLSVTIYGKDRSPKGLDLPQADWLSYSPGEIILKRGEFVVWVRSSTVSMGTLSSVASMTAQQVSIDASRRESGNTPAAAGVPSRFDLPEILPSYPDRDTFFSTGSASCVLYRDAWLSSTCPG